MARKTAPIFNPFPGNAAPCAGLGDLRQNDPLLAFMPPVSIVAGDPGDAAPVQDRGTRISFVGIDDNGTRKLWPNTPLIVQPCETFLGFGIYQLTMDGRLVVRECMARSRRIVAVAVDNPGRTTRDFRDISMQDFEDRVCSLVLCQIETINRQWMNALLKTRSIHYGN